MSMDNDNVNVDARGVAIVLQTFMSKQSKKKIPIPFLLEFVNGSINQCLILTLHL